MKSLALLRHAKSSWDEPALGDFDRPLTRRGIEAATRIGAEMRRRGLVFDRVLASPATRVVETLEHLQRGYGESLDPQFDGGIYGAPAARLLEIVQAVDDSVGRVLLVGHNPGLEELAVLLAESGEPLRDSIARGYPTAALAMLQLPVESWREVRAGTAQVADFVRPRELLAQKW